MEPKKGGCNPADKTLVVYRPTSSKCQDDSSKFAFDPDRGIIPFVIGHNFSTGISLSEDINRLSKVNILCNFKSLYKEKKQEIKFIVTETQHIDLLSKKTCAKTFSATLMVKIKVFT